MMRLIKTIIIQTYFEIGYKTVVIAELDYFSTTLVKLATICFTSFQKINTLPI